MAEIPAGSSAFDTGGGAEAGKRGLLGMGGNNQFQADVRRINELNTSLTNLNKQISTFKDNLPKVVSLTKDWATEMERLAKAMNGMGGAMPGGGGGAGYIKPAGELTQQVAGGGGGGFGGIQFINVNRSQNLTVQGAGGIGGGGGGGGRAGGIAQEIAGALQPLFAALNNRIQSNAQYSLSANRLDMLYQQTTGLSGQQVRDTYRAPLQQYKLGMGGINQVLALQASTGINAQMQAQSVEALRAASGFAYSTEQINTMTRGLASPEVANRMFMMGGTGLYGIGGKQNSTMDVVKSTVQRLGLSDARKLQGAMAPGSATREQLRQMGVPEDMHDIVLQYAQQNLTYKNKGGVGMYDPSSKAARSFMGVENNYATQYEETERIKAGREESMYNKQANNYADMEKQMQSLIKTLQKVEEAFAGLIGAKIRNRGVGQMLGGLAPMAGTIIGGAIGAFGGPAGMAAGAMLGGAFGNIVKGFVGDPTGEKETSSSKVKTSGTSNIAKSHGALQKLHPKMRERIQRMLEDNPRLYVGEGVRSSADQKKMFLERYEPTTEKTDVYWQGKYWKRVRGAAAAPPGMSMHEIGLAVDLAPTTEFDWIKENAHKYGLRSFFDVNDEPWHVQPAELPAGRMEYEKMGAPWGHNGVVAEPTDTKARIGGMLEHSGMSSGTSGEKGTTIQKYSGLSMGETISAMEASLGSSDGSVTSTGQLSKGFTNPTARGTGSGKWDGPGSMSGVAVARLLYQAGFRGKGLVQALAIAKRESGFNPSAFNGNEKTKDESYGLFQINMRGSLGPSRRNQYGLKKNEELYDPAVNAEVAYKLSGGGKDFYHWGGYKGKENTYKTNIKEAEGFVKQAGYKTTGDPMGSYEPTLNKAGGATVIQGDSGNSYHVTIAPTIQLMGGNNQNADVERMAREVTKLLDREVRMTLLRTS